ncbi:MAG: hypothetical protein SV760_00335 [Halobacteria archaeon]|nr:hypothetical protein [Halobacteria archaeon]
MSYADDRLKLGILNVGFVTVAAVVALGLNLTEKVIVFAGSPAQDILALVVVVGLYAAASLPFDIAGGYYLPRKHDREFPSFPSFVLGWLRGVAVQSGAFVVLGSLILGSGRVGGAAGATLAFAAGTLLLLVLRRSARRFRRAFSRKARSNRGVVRRSFVHGRYSVRKGTDTPKMAGRFRRRRSDCCCGETRRRG